MTLSKFLAWPSCAFALVLALAAGPVDLGLFNADVGRRVMGLVAAGTITVEHVELRLQNVLAGLLAEVARQCASGKPNPAEGDVAVEIAISLLGITPAKARKLAHGKLPPLAPASI